ncbi:hypothetical protein DPMN_011014 [Dreissena polymorpha]|uniref:Uncharacterized protein n=1 Tax=Dreissena polymorpha TaxID=45954 RepID=A0A9D4RZT7_DREPO|nr:hypothetical protein DPMN_010994 [Dreissena polymorpha]KAH3887001.1 hypothetical protein DPMN_011014 [Dreissena polymorpha]
MAAAFPSCPIRLNPIPVSYKYKTFSCIYTVIVEFHDCINHVLLGESAVHYSTMAWFFDTDFTGGPSLQSSEV